MIITNNKTKIDIRDKIQINRKSAISENLSVLTDIYKEDVNIAVWQQKLSDDLIRCSLKLLEQYPNFKAEITATPSDVYEQLIQHLDKFSAENELCLHISLLVDMFCTLFELKHVGLRLVSLDRAMCPKFHVDIIPCRLVTTFSGSTTQWLDNNVIDRSKLGAGSKGLPDEESGLLQNHNDINKLSVGDVALLKGEGWFKNEGGGLVHRSPNLANENRRLLLTLDFID
jgi:hypothetical protein